MTKVRIVFSAIVIAGIAACLIIRHRSQVRFDERESLLQKQKEQLAALTSEHQRLTNLLARVDRARPERSTELARLSLEAKALKSQTKNLGQQLGKNDAQSKPDPAQNPESHPPEYWKKLRELAAAPCLGIYCLCSGSQRSMPNNDRSINRLHREKKTVAVVREQSI